MGNKFGWHSGVLTCKDAKVKGDLYVQDDIVFSDVSAGVLGITGGIDMQSTTSAIGIDMGGSFTSSAINIDGTLTGRAISIGSKNLPGTSTDGSLKISTTGYTLDVEPSNNYLFGLFSKVSASEATSSDELRGAWIRTRVNDGCHVGSNAGWGYGVCGAEIQLKVYATSAATNMYSWQNSAIWAQLETQGASGINFKSGSYSQCILANVGLTSTTTIDSGANVAGITINSNTSSSNVTATGGFYGLFITDKSTSNLDFKYGIYIGNSVATSGIYVGTPSTAGIVMPGGASYNPIHIGVKHSTDADYGLILTGATDDPGGILVFCDDGGDALSSVTSPIWTRYLLTANHGANGETATGAFFQTKTKTGLTFTTGSYTALKAFLQIGGTLVTDNASTEVAIINAGISFEGNYTCTSGTMSGIDININDGSKTIGTHTGLLVRKTSSSTAGWTTGISLTNCVTGINIGACTTPITITGASTQVFDFTGNTTSIAEDDKTYGSKAGSIKILMPSGSTAYINVYDGSAS